MLQNLSVGLRAVCVSIPLILVVACGQGSKGKKAKPDEGAGAQGITSEANLSGCLGLGGTGYEQGPNQNVVVVPDYTKGYEPPPPGYQPYPCQSPGQYPQNPCEYGCEDGYAPIDVPLPVQYPTQQPIVVGGCGKVGTYCDDGGPGQWPTQAIGGKRYDRHAVEQCLGAFRNRGYNTQGQWNIDVREVNSVNVLSQGTVSDFGRHHSIVLIKNVSVLGRTNFQLLNPNALYCIENVSVFDEMFVDSCHTGNVVFGKDVNVLSAVHTRPIMCQ